MNFTREKGKDTFSDTLKSETEGGVNKQFTTNSY